MREAAVRTDLHEDGALKIVIAGHVSGDRLGTGSAEFLVCANCGVVPAVVWAAEGRLLSVVRVECLKERDALLAHASQTDFDDEALAQRLTRRLRNWTPATVDTGSVSTSDPAAAPSR